MNFLLSLILTCIILSQKVPMGLIREWGPICQKATRGWGRRGLNRVFTVPGIGTEGLEMGHGNNYGHCVRAY